MSSTGDADGRSGEEATAAADAEGADGAGGADGADGAGGEGSVGDAGAEVSPDDATLSVRGLSKRYGDTVALDDVDLAVEEGAFVTVVGPSGCGKSTLLRVLSGLEGRFEGHAAVNGTDVRDGGSDDVGMVFQEPRLLPWATVRGNVAVGLPEGVDVDDPAAAARVDELIETVGLDGFASHRPGELSGGMVQRVSLARGLAYEPSVLLLDEPFSALDQLTKYEQQDNLLDVWRQQGATVVLVTHDVEEAAYLSDRVIVLGGQPGTVATVVDVDVERPRERTDAGLLAVREEITDALGL